MCIWFFICVYLLFEIHLNFFFKKKFSFTFVHIIGFGVCVCVFTLPTFFLIFTQLRLYNFSDILDLIVIIIKRETFLMDSAKSVYIYRTVLFVVVTMPLHRHFQYIWIFYFVVVVLYPWIERKHTVLLKTITWNYIYLYIIKNSFISFIIIHAL